MGKSEGKKTRETPRRRWW